jgi:hypothetical protein
LILSKFYCIVFIMLYNYANVPRREVTDQQLLEVSQDLWGSEVYGATVVSMLQSGRHFVDSAVWSVDDFTSDPVARTVDYHGHVPRSEEDMRGLALDKWDAAHYPYEPAAHNYNEAGGQYPAYLNITPGMVTRLRLADFGRNRGYDSHELHGTLGKAFDVVAVASGIKKAMEVGTAHVETEFITAKELRAHLRAFGLPPYYRNEINTELTFAIMDAVHYSKARKYGEVIFEGHVVTEPGHKFEQVAVASLVSMADMFPETRLTAQALRKLAKS